MTPSSEGTETVVGKDTLIKGNVVSKGVLRIEGKVEGEIEHAGDVIVGEGGTVTAKVKATRLSLAGNISGDVEVDNRIELAPSARLSGDVKTAELIVAEGAMLNGAVEMKEQEKTTGKAAESEPTRVLRTA